MLDRIPLLLLLWTSLYVAFVAVIEVVAPTCSTKSSCTQGLVDDTVVAWATAFFVAGTCGVMGLHLVYLTKQRDLSIRKEARVGQVLLGIASTLEGFALAFFGDNQRQGENAGWFGLNAARYFVLALMCGTFGKLTLSALKDHDPGRKGSMSCCCCFRWLDIFGTRCWLRIHNMGVLASAMVIVGASIRCAIPQDTTSSTTTLPQSLETSSTRSEQVIYYGQILFWAFFATCWISIALLSRRAIRGAEDQLQGSYSLTFAGLKAKHAAAPLIPVLVLAAILYPEWLRLASVFVQDNSIFETTLPSRYTLASTWLDLMETCYGSIVFHYGLGMLSLLVHDISLALTHKADHAAVISYSVQQEHEEILEDLEQQEQQRQWGLAVEDLTLGAVKAKQQQDKTTTTTTDQSTMEGSVDPTETPPPSPRYPY